MSLQLQHHVFLTFVCNLVQTRVVFSLHVKSACLAVAMQPSTVIDNVKCLTTACCAQSEQETKTRAPIPKGLTGLVCRLFGWWSRFRDAGAVFVAFLHIFWCVVTFC
jgi:hypothetical protein